MFEGVEGMEGGRWGWGDGVWTWMVVLRDNLPFHSSKVEQKPTIFTVNLVKMFLTNYFLKVQKPQKGWWKPSLDGQRPTGKALLTNVNLRWNYPQPGCVFAQVSSPPPLSPETHLLLRLHPASVLGWLGRVGALGCLWVVF